MTKPVEHEYSSHVAYTRALEEYCTSLEEAVISNWQWYEDRKTVVEQAAQIAYLKDFIFDYVDVEPNNEKMLAKYALVYGIKTPRSLEQYRKQVLEEVAAKCAEWVSDDVPCGLGGTELAAVIKGMKEV